VQVSRPIEYSSGTECRASRSGAAAGAGQQPRQGGDHGPASEAHTILATARTPADAVKLTLTQLRGLLKRAGRSRGLDTEATRLRDAFRVSQMRQLPLVEQAMGRQAIALLGTACTSADDLEQAVTESFNLHPDAGIITSFPGLGPIAGARVLAEIGDDRSRFADAKGLSRRRDAGDRHAAAQRNLFGRLLGCLWHCLITGQEYDETIAFPVPANKLPKAA